VKKLPLIIILFAIFLLLDCTKKDNEEELVIDVYPANPIMDIDGNIYQTVIIGNQAWYQWWMTENLRTSKYANGDTIPNVKDTIKWHFSTSGAWVNYKNDSTYEIPYGKLYNWHAVADTRNICPDGWHVPSKFEWYQLIIYLDHEYVAGGHLKEAGTDHWDHPNTGATNVSGITALPGGKRYYSSNYPFNGWKTLYNYINKSGNYWTSTKYSSYGSGKAYSASMNYNSSKCYLDVNWERLTNGLSVRCIKD